MSYPESKKPILTERGLENKAPQHRENALQDSYKNTLRAPLNLQDLSNPANKSYTQRINDFSLDPDGKNRWRLTGFIRAVNPSFYENPNLGALQAYINSGMGSCHVCGHSPIVNHYVVEHPTKGKAFVGSECIGKVLGASVEKTVKTVTSRTIRNYNNKLKLKSLLDQYESFFSTHPDLLNITSGFYQPRYIKYLSKCTLTASIEKYIEEHQNCSEFMKKAHETHARGMINAIYDNGCKKHESFDTWYKKHEKDPKYQSKCDDKTNMVVVSDLSEIKPVEGCPNSKSCWVSEPINSEVSGREILNKIRQAHERNYKDIDYIFTDIKNFNKWHVKFGDKKYEGKVPTEIPIYSGRSLEKEPLTESEEAERGELMKQAVGELIKK